MSTRKKIDENSYKIIKTLAENGMSKTDICKVYGVSKSTCRRVVLSKSLEDYRKMVNEEAAKANAREKERRAEKKETVEVNFSEAQLQIIVELLNSIDAKLRILMDEQADKKHGLFRR